MPRPDPSAVSFRRLATTCAIAALPLVAAGSALAETTANALLPQNLSPWGMFMGADIVVKVVMVGLAFASLLTWTVCVAKMMELRSVAKLARQRFSILEGNTTLARAAQNCRDADDAVAQLVRSAAEEAELSDVTYDSGFTDRVALRLERVQTAVARRVARGTGILATIGATAPFVGLFGTVWGIMNSFIGISEAHTTNLAVVAPGIAEALLATALGLVAAIPAVVIYNHLVRMITGYRALLADASAQVMLMISREQSSRTHRLARAAE